MDIGAVKSSVNLSMFFDGYLYIIEPRFIEMIGIIAGSGLYYIEGAVTRESRALNTPFGEPSDSYRIVDLDNITAVFLARHGSKHNTPPHMINYRANIWGFKALGVEKIISVNAVGGISRQMKPGAIVVLDQVIDMTGGARASTFYDKEEVVHVDFTNPYCDELRKCILGAGRNIIKPDNLIDSGTYICVNGPRLESAAEIKFFSVIGADVVGMTGMPEAALARELGMCFSGISVVTNYAAGLTGRKLTTKEVLVTMDRSKEIIKAILKETIRCIPADRTCTCKSALEDTKM